MKYVSCIYQINNMACCPVHCANKPLRGLCFTYTHTLNLFANFRISLKSGTGRLGTAGVTTLSFAMALQTLGMSSQRLCPDYVLYSLCYQLASCCLFNLQGPLLLTQYLHCLGWIQSWVTLGRPDKGNHFLTCKSCIIFALRLMSVEPASL